MSSTTSNNSPPIFSDAEKFDGSNWIAWKSNVKIVVNIRGALGYLEGKIPKPATTSPMNASNVPMAVTETGDTTATLVATTIAAETTPWPSPTPSPDEWRARDAWVLGLIVFNVKNPVGLGIKMDGTASDAWKSLTDQYELRDDVALINAQRDLRNTMFKDGGDLPNHIAALRTKWAVANAVGAGVDDGDFRMILLSSLPASWDTIVATLYDSKSSGDAIAHLLMHWARISKTSSSTVPSAFQTNTNGNGPSNHQNRTRLVCTNPNCGRQGHTIEKCYWPGGGKAGQFPVGFGQH